MQQPLVTTKKTSPQAPVPVFADAGEGGKETHSFNEGGVCAPVTKFIEVDDQSS